MILECPKLIIENGQFKNIEEVLVWLIYNDPIYYKSFREAQHMQLSLVDQFRYITIRMWEAKEATNKALMDNARNYIPQIIITKAPSNPSPD